MRNGKAEPAAEEVSLARRTGRAKPKMWYAAAARNINTQIGISAAAARNYFDGKIDGREADAVRAHIDVWLDSLMAGHLIPAEAWFQDWAVIGGSRIPKPLHR